MAQDRVVSLSGPVIAGPYSLCDWHGPLLEGDRPLRELQCLPLAEQQGCPSRGGI